MYRETGNGGFNFIWRIQNFSHALEQKREWIESPVFKMADSDDTGWCLLLYPRGNTGESIGLYLQPKNFNRDRKDISTNYALSLLSADGKILTSSKMYHTFEMENQTYFRHGYNTFMSLVALENKRIDFLPDDTLTVCCRIMSIDSKQIDPGSVFARSRIDVQKTSFIWRIENFRKFRPKQKASILLESVSTKMDLTFPFEVLECENLQIEISQLDISRKNLLSCKISLLDVNGETVDFEKGEHLFEGNINESWKFPQFVPRGMLLSQKSQYLPRDVLTLRCDLVISAGVIFNEIEMYGINLNQTVKSIHTIALEKPNHPKGGEMPFQSHTLMQDLRQLYEDHINSDISLQVVNATFPAHKSVLSARSPVFRAMFEKDMLENKTGVVDIPDLEEETVRKVLIFLYTDTVEDLQWKDAINLYTAAEKYDIPQLKLECLSVLISGVNQSNVVELLVLANLHSDGYLKMCAQDFFLGREKKILASEEWKTLKKYNFDLAAEVMEYILMKK